MFPLVREMAAAGARIRVAVACRVLGLSTQGCYKWLKDPVSQRDWDDAHLSDVLYELPQDDATLGYRSLTHELADAHGISAGENCVHRPCQTHPPSLASRPHRSGVNPPFSSPWPAET